MPDQTVVEWLKEFSETHPDFRLRYIIATHYHEDHICWIDDVVNAGLLDPNGVVYDRGSSYSSNTFAEYQRAVAGYRQSISSGQVIHLGENATLQCLVVAGQVHGNGSITTSDENNLSLGFLLSYGAFQLWVGGDLEEEVEQLVKDVIGDVDVYVVHHHGSSTSSTASFLNAIKPEVAICQVGRNPYEHPHTAIVSRILRTQDTDGNPDNDTPMLILQNKGSYFANYSKVYIADPDGEGPQPGTIYLHTDGTSCYTISAPGIPEPIKITLDSQEREAKSYCTVSVIVETAELVYNNHVGNEWSLRIVVNDKVTHFSSWGLPKTVWEGALAGNTSLTVTVYAVEDEKYPDVGSAKATFNVSCLEPSSQAAVLEVVVREDRGRYAGNTALWRFKVLVKVSSSLE